MTHFSAVIVSAMTQKGSLVGGVGKMLPWDLMFHKPQTHTLIEAVFQPLNNPIWETSAFEMLDGQL